MANEAESALKSVFFRRRLTQPREVAVRNAANCARKVEADDGAVGELELGLAVQAFDQLQLAGAVGGELKADIGVAGDPFEIGGVLEEGKCCDVIEVEVCCDVGRVGRAVDRDRALAVALIELDVLERCRHGAVLDGDGDGRLADGDVLEVQLADVQVGVAVGDVEQREVQLLARPAGALDGAVDLGRGRRRCVEQVLDGVRIFRAVAGAGLQGRNRLHTRVVRAAAVRVVALRIVAVPIGAWGAAFGRQHARHGAG